MKPHNKIKAVLITNVPAPYRVPMLRALAEQNEIDLEVIYCAKSSIDSTLDNADQGFKTHFLHGRYVIMEKRFMHVDLSVIALLERIRPDVVITTGFIPTYLFAFAWSVVRRVAHVAMTDGTAASEAGLTRIHQLARKIVFKRSASFVGASLGSLRLFRNYGIAEDLLHLSRLCIYNERFNLPRAPDAVDFIFCGRFLQHKRPRFAIDVARRVAETIGRKTSLNFVGQGEQEDELRAYADTLRDFVDVQFLGYASQADLPQRYAEARVFLFPSEWDPWGLVANEACAAGLPVVVSPHAGVAGELILDGVNGYVRPLDLEAWAEVCARLILDQTLYNRLSSAGRKSVEGYTFGQAAAGLADAIRQAVVLHRNPKAAAKLIGTNPDDRLTPRNDGIAAHEKIRERHVCIIQAVAKQYRLSFFNLLYERLRQEGVVLTVIYSDPNPREAERKDAVNLPVTYGRKVRAYWGLNYHLVYQACLFEVLRADLVIVEQANKHALNHILSCMRVFGLTRLGLWGHGRNWQFDGTPWLEPFKRTLLRKADWWFAYTSKVARYVEDSGFSSNQITVVQNSVDTESFRMAVEALDMPERLAIRHRNGVSATAPLGLYCGSMHASKFLGFLVEAAIQIRQRVPNFQLVLIGAGPEETIACDAARTHDWIQYKGPLFDAEKAAQFAIADIFLCPGQVGLAVLEAFAAGLPLFTTNTPVHSPEIDYLTDMVTGTITEFDPEVYARAVSDALCDRARLVQMSAAAREASDRYGLEPMVENFTQGVLACLNRY